MREIRAGLWVLAIVCSSVIAGIAAAPALALSPSVETQTATAVTGSGATLRGKVNPNGSATSYYFEYGTTASYGSKTVEASAGSGAAVVEESEPISGLSPGTTYHFRIVASNSSGTSYGADQTFSTLVLPVVATVGALEISGEGATLYGIVNPKGLSTTYQFEYGTTSGSYSATVPIPAASAGSASTGKVVSQKVTGLTQDTKYYFRITAMNANGESSGGETSFVTLKKPGVVPSGSSRVSQAGATLGATIETRGLATNYYVEYGTTTSYGSKTASEGVSGEPENSPVSQRIEGLKPNTLYHYRWVVQSASGTAFSADQVLTTLDDVTLRLVGGAELKKGDPLKLFGSGFKFGTRSCSEAEISGEVELNPGAVQRVTGAKMQNVGMGCEWGTFNIKYAWSGIKTRSLEYANNLGTGILYGELELTATVYNLNMAKQAECEYILTFAGDYKTSAALVMVVSGETKKVKGSLCPLNEVVSGTLSLTSGGTPVEAKP